MANLAKVTYKCVGSKQSIHKLYGIIDHLVERHKAAYGSYWLGNLIEDLGADWHSRSCRGEIVDYDIPTEEGDDWVFTIWQECAWTEQEGVRQTIEEAFPDVKVYFQVIEPGCQIFITNSKKWFSDKWCIDTDSNRIRTVETDNELLEYLSDFFNVPVSSIAEATVLTEKYNKETDDGTGTKWCNWDKIDLVNDQGEIVNEDF